MTDRQAITIDDETRGDAIARVLALLDEGGLVCLPTETVYGIGGRADRPQARERLAALKAQGGRPFTLHVGSSGAALALARPPAQARRLARAYWPGPLTLVLPATADAAEQAGTEDGTVGLRVVAHQLTAEICERAGAPLLLSSANLPGMPPPTDAAAATAAIGEFVDLVIDDGPCSVATASTVVRVDAEGAVAILREGALARDDVLARAATLVLFVCSGNTCRSPMAAAIAQARWAETFGVPTERLIERGLLVSSAGTSAIPGMPASENAIKAAAELGLDLRAHRSRVLEPALVARASRTFCAGESHLRTALAMLEHVGGPFDEDAATPELLGGDVEVEDPFGGDLARYRATRDQMAELIPERPQAAPDGSA